MRALPSLESLIDEVIDREGDYVHHPADRGGPTRWGITESVARAQGFAASMRLLPRETAADIYRRIYWLAPGFDRISGRAPRVAAELFDTGVNMGTATAIGFLQRALNALNRSARDYPDIAVDRAIGPATLHALDGLLRARGPRAETVLLRAIEALQGNATSRSPNVVPAKRPFSMAGSRTVSVLCNGCDFTVTLHRLHELCHQEQ